MTEIGEYAIIGLKIIGTGIIVGIAAALINMLLMAVLGTSLIVMVLMVLIYLALAILGGGFVAKELFKLD